MASSWQYILVEERSTFEGEDEDALEDGVKCALTDLNEIKPRLTKAALLSLTEFWRKTRQLSLDRFPMQHFIVEQVCLAVFDTSDKLKKFRLNYIDMRDHFENIYCLQMLLMKHHKMMALYVSNLFVKLLTMTWELAQDLEKISSVPVTKWKVVMEMVKMKDQGIRAPSLHEMVPAMTFFVSGRLLGAGGFGAVYKAMFGQCVCTVKFVPINKLPSPKLACVDKVVAGMVNHPFVVKYYACFATVQAFCTCMEFIRGVDLVKVLRAATVFPEHVNMLVIAQLGAATQHLHFKGFAHRDIKPANMMVQQGLKVKLIDFDTAKLHCGKYSSRPLQSFYNRTAAEVMDGERAGTAPFFAPEVIARKKYGRSVDWWAIGVTVYNQATGKLPFNGRDLNDLNAKIIAGKYTWPQDLRVSDTVKTFTGDLLKRLSAQRLCSGTYQDFQSHAFFRKLDWNWLLSTRVVLDYKPLLDCMRGKDGKLSPVASPAAIEKRRKLFPQERFDDTDDQKNLYTFASPGFMRCLRLRREGGTPTDKEIVDPFEKDLEEPKAVYKFTKQSATCNVSMELPIFMSRQKKMFMFESWGFSLEECTFCDAVFFLVSDLVPNSPASKAGLVFGDMVLRINDKTIFGLNLQQVNALLKTGDKVQVTIHPCNTFRYLQERRDMSLILSTLRYNTVKLVSSVMNATTSSKDFEFETRATPAVNERGETLFFLLVSKAKCVEAQDPPGVNLCVGDVVVSVGGTKISNENIDLMNGCFAGHFQSVEISFIPLSPVRIERANLTHMLVTADANT